MTKSVNYNPFFGHFNNVYKKMFYNNFGGLLFMDFKKLFGYEGKTVVITGAASGMSRSATELLLELGAEVYAIDKNPIDLPVKKAYQADLSDKDAIDAIVKDLPGKIDALFLCHGIAGFKGRELLVQKVNFYSQKYMTEQLLDRISDHGSVTYIASVGGFGWEQVYPKAVELINLPTWEDAMKWYDEHPKEIESSYVFAKQCLLSYVTYKCMSQDFIGRKIRINAINPGDTTTGLTDDFNKSTSPTGNAEEGAAMISNIFLKSWNGYAAEPIDMAGPMVAVGSNICSYMSGQLIYVDYGLTSNWKSQALLASQNKTIEELSHESQN